jgi:glycosyltransferase involved in cell wall biosynthesis
VVHYLTEELVREGHEVTLFASGDSVTSANLVPTCPAALRLEGGNVDPLALHFVMLEEVFRAAANFDIVHFHVDYLHFPATRRVQFPHVTTLHGRLDLPALKELYREFPDVPLVSISDAQRVPLPWANWQGTVYHGLPLDLLPPGSGDGGYLAFLGRISPEKRVDRAIEISKRAGLPLKVAAKVDDADRQYFETQIRHLCEGPSVDFVGEIDESKKAEFLGKAKALLFPIDWPEPFGLVMIEALACGTPVIAFRGGSVDEVIQHGSTGFVVTNVDDAVTAVEHIGEIRRETCREVFESRFSANRMAADYLKIYARLSASSDGVENKEPVSSE